MSLLTKASTVTTPTAYSEGLLHSVKPVESLGSEEVTNGRFATDSDWTKVGNVTIQNGIAAFVDNGTNANSYIEQNVLTASKNYKVIIEVTRYVAGRIQIVAGSNTYNLNISSGTGVYKLYVESGSGTIFRIKRNGSYANFNFDIDNVSVKEVLENADFDFARASSATRVNEEGYIEKERENLLLQSNQFNTTWTISNASVVGNQSGIYNTTDAWKLVGNGNNNDKVLQNVASGTSTFSIYAKAGNLNFTIISLGNGFAYYNIETGVVTSSSGVVSTNIESIGNGWYRLSITVALTSSSNVQVYIASADGSVVTNNGDFIYLQHAQLEQGLVATDYIETTTSSVAVGITNNIPRINYEGGNGHFLLEPQRTNLVTYSEDFSHSNWQKGRTEVLLNTAISPDGNFNASTLSVINATGGEEYLRASSINSNPAVCSIYVKKGNWRYITIRSVNISVFDFDTETFTLTGANETLSFEKLQNGWYRLKASSPTRTYCSVGFATNATATSGSGINGSYMYIWGAQLEAGSYATSYIPTFGSSVTRAAETCNNAGDSDLFNDSEGVLYAEVATQHSGTKQITLNDNSLSNVITFIFLDNNTQIQFVVVSGGAIQLNRTETATLSVYNKIALKYKANDFDIYINGSKIYSDTSGSTPAGLNTIEFNKADDSDNFYGKTKMVSTFTEALSDSELECLTSWSSFNRMATAQNYNIE